MSWRLTSFGLVLTLLLGCSGERNRDTYTGILEGRIVQVPAMTSGKVLSLYVDTGDRVNAGDTLAVVDTTDLMLQRRQLEAGLKEITVREALARTNLNRARADLNYAKQRLQRVQSLFEKQAVPRQKLDDVKNLVDRAESAFKAARQQWQVTAAKRQQLEAQLALLDKKLRDAVILSPLAGVVSNRYYNPGEAVPPLHPVIEITHVAQLDVKIYVPEELLPSVKVGQNASIHVDGLNRTLRGRVVWVSPKAEFSPKTILTPETRTSLVYAVKITVSNPDGTLKHGMPVEVRL